MNTPLATHILNWQEDGRAAALPWCNSAAQKPPLSAAPAPTTLSAQTALSEFRHSRALIWRNDYHQAVQLLSAVKRRLTPPIVGNDFHVYRMQQAQRSRILNMLLVEIDGSHRLNLPRAPQTTEALSDVFGTPDGQAFLLPLNLLLGYIGARQWYEKGIFLPVLEGRIHVPFGVFSPVRGEYLDLVAAQPLPPGCTSAFDIGTGSGVIAAILAKRGIPQITATDNNPRAIAAARANLTGLGLHADIQNTDLFPDGSADLIVCNPPWLPAKPSSDIETALYDPDSTMLRGFLAQAHTALNPGGEVWLIMSDLAEHLGLRRPGELAALLTEQRWQIRRRHDTKPRHPKSRDPHHPLAAARRQETVSLYVLQPVRQPASPNCSRSINRNRKTDM